MITRQSVNRGGTLLIALLGFFWIVFVLRAAQIQILQHREFEDYADAQQQSTMPLSARRGSIYDSKGRLLAYDVDAKSYTVNPKYMKRPSDAAGELAAITGKPKSYWLQQFGRRPGFLVVARRVSPDLRRRFENSGIETLRSRSESIRMYPYGDLATEVIGRTDADNKGLSGIECYYDSLLSGADGQSIYLRDAYGREVTAWEHTLVPPRNGSDIYLTLDLNLQEILESELQKMLDSSGANWGTAVFLDVETGGVLASGTAERDKPAFKRCRAIVDMNEPGSTAKIIPLATVFQAGIFEPDDIVNVENGRFMVGGHLIRDDHAHGSLRCSEIGVYSSNIGAAKLGLAAGADLIYRTLIQFGFGVKTTIDFPGETPGVVYKPSTWGRHGLATICFGYGFAASSLQLACAYGAVASGGELHRPFFATKVVSGDSTERVLNSKMVVRKILDERTLAILDDVFRNVVQVGTAKKAMDERCPIAGKTGTALRRKKDSREYASGKALASFVGYFPAGAPKIVGIVMFDEPGFSIYGGDVSAPVFKNIARRYTGLPQNNMMVNSKTVPEAKRSAAGSFSAQDAQVVAVAAKRASRTAIGQKRPSSAGGFPDFTGQTMRDAIRSVKDKGLACRITGAGMVVAQNPPPGLDTTGVEIVELIGEP